MSSTAGWWEGWPWRLVQTNLREVDMEDLDAERYVASLRDLGATVAMINTSGIVASYATALPFHTRSAHLQGDDLATIVDACHAADIKVIARTDFSKVRPELHARHPEWATRTADGGIVVDGGDVHVCPSGAYQRRFASRIVRETLTVLDVDGIFFNMAGFQRWDYRGVDHGLCRCDACVLGFRSFGGSELPDAPDLDDPVYRRYLAYQRAVLVETKERIDATIRRLRPEVAIDRPSDDRGGFVRQESNTALDRSPTEWIYSASSNTKWVVASLPRTVSSNSSVDFVDYPVRHVAVSPHRQRLRLARALANGGGLDHYVIGRLDRRHDRSGLAAARELFAFHAAHEDAYRGLASCARVALLTGEHGDAADHRGWFEVLATHHVPFDVLLLDRAGPDVLGRYAVLILPDALPVADAAAERLDRFVHDGGTLVASGRAALRTDELEPRDRPALACLGIEEVRAIRHGLRGAYLAVDRPEAFPRLRDTDLLFLDGVYVDATYRPEAERHLRLIPPGPFGPPERCVLPEPTGEPGLVLHPFGAGRAVVVPWACGALAHRYGLPNTTGFAADVLERHAGAEPLGGNLSPMVEVTLFERPDGGRLLHLVNGSGEASTGCVEPVAMRDVEVVVPFPGEPSSVRGLVGGRELGWRASADRITIELPELRLFEAVAIGPAAAERPGAGTRGGR